MSEILQTNRKQQAMIERFLGAVMPAASSDSEYLAKTTSQLAFANIGHATASPITMHRAESSISSLEDLLFTARAKFKIKTNKFAMNFGSDWQHRFFTQLDVLLSLEDWDPADTIVSDASFATLVRLLLILRGRRRPGLGLANDGNIVAAWAHRSNRLTIECCPDDRVRWIVSQIVDDELDTTVGQTNLSRILGELAPYKPEQWFNHEAQKAST